ncbi:unnamed protein product, partial [Ectocarpus sp. 4 AP-2014]
FGGAGQQHAICTSPCVEQSRDALLKTSQLATGSTNRVSSQHHRAHACLVPCRQPDVLLHSSRTYCRCTPAPGPAVGWCLFTWSTTLGVDQDFSCPSLGNWLKRKDTQ